MPSFIARQPNGRLCRWSTVCNNLTHINMTDEDYIEICAERARREARFTLMKFVKPFSFILDHREDITAQYQCDLECDEVGCELTEGERNELECKIKELEAEFDQNIKLMTEPADHWELI